MEDSKRSQIIYSLSKNEIHANNDQIFRNLCIKGDLAAAQMVYSLGDVDIHAKNDDAFMNSNLPVKKWLWSLDENGFRKVIWRAFIYSCANGHLLVAQWLWERWIVNRAVPIDALTSSCAGGHLDIAKWLVSIGANIRADGDGALISACAYHRANVAKWLCEMEPRYRVSFGVYQLLHKILTDDELMDEQDLPLTKNANII